MDEIKSLTLKPREDRRLLRGHLWVFRNELLKDPAYPDGAVVDLFNETRRFIGRGFYQAAGGIAARILTRHQEELDATFWRARLESARIWRERVFPGSEVYRWVFGESDALPGLVIDRYGSVAVCSTSSAYYAQHAQIIMDTLLEQGVRGVSFQAQEMRVTKGEVPERVEFAVEGLQMELNLTLAQKTGLFLDQRLNSKALRTYAPGARVLDGHCYHGIWSCHAAQAGAAQVTAVDSSSVAIEQARRNASLNGVSDRCTFITGDVEEHLKSNTYDVVVLDPPAFAKSRQLAKKALSRYQALNANAMKAVAPGGMLITSSCSHFVSAEEYVEVLKRAAATAKRQAWLVDLRGASPDHPVSLQMPETNYLKCAYLRLE